MVPDIVIGNRSAPSSAHLAATQATKVITDRGVLLLLIEHSVDVVLSSAKSSGDDNHQDRRSEKSNPIPHRDHILDATTEGCLCSPAHGRADRGRVGDAGVMARYQGDMGEVGLR